MFPELMAAVGAVGDTSIATILYLTSRMTPFPLLRFSRMPMHAPKITRSLRSIFVLWQLVA
jgi:hypothetical protein